MHNYLQEKLQTQASISMTVSYTHLQELLLQFNIYTFYSFSYSP
uniref:Uncharacterized protein n=1 Tax=Arundo donax TaxID=35708 RepID=A0A0A9FJ89_ARUDO